MKVHVFYGRHRAHFLLTMMLPAPCIDVLSPNKRTAPATSYYILEPFLIKTNEPKTKRGKATLCMEGS